MAIKTIDAGMLQKMFLAGAREIEGEKEHINELNVFPVPDGDTGTNMTLTIMSAASEVEKITEPTMTNLSKAISMGALRGARGNSGVILSQLFRGFTKVIKECDVIDMKIMAEATARASETAYKAVMKPKEGTILTVARCMSEKLAEIAIDCDDLEIGLKQTIEHGEYVLSQTPELLPVLKQAGVVDSGGEGLLTVIKGSYKCLVGEDTYSSRAASTESGKESAAMEEETAPASDIETADIKFGYCTEFIIRLVKEFNEQTAAELKAYLSSIGDSIVCVWSDDIVKIHVHTNDPGLALQKALGYGSLTDIKIDNMREEHEEKLAKDAGKKTSTQARSEGAEDVDQTSEKKVESIPSTPRKEAGFISVSVGAGLSEIFKGLGVDYVIEGGQTMNPSTEDILNAIDQVNANTVYILPNNKNIILAAGQAKSMITDKEILVIPSVSIPQGITAMISYMPGESSNQNEELMTEGMQNVRSGEVTYAVRDTMIGDQEIKEGNIMGIGDHDILTVGEDISATTRALIDKLMDGEADLISIYYGESIDEETAQSLADQVGKDHPECDVELQCGGQPIYYYIVSVE